jgi:Xaa-Pro aminopeptidase
MAFPQERINTPISTAELERRWAAVRAAMADQGIDVLLMQANNDFMGGNVKYFTDLAATNGYPVTVIFPVDEPMTLIHQGGFDQEIDVPAEGDGLHRGVGKVMMTPSFAAAGYTVKYDAELAAKALAPYTARTIGLVGLGQIPIGFLDHLRDGAFANTKFVDATDLVDQIKVIKSAEELEVIRKTARMQDGCWQAVLDGIRPGMTDLEATGLAEYYGLQNGSEQGWYMAGSGKVGEVTRFRSRHYLNRRIEKGDTFTILIENSGAGGMFTEIGRTCVLGKASEEMKEQFAFALEAQQFTVNLFKPGASSAEIWERYNDFMRANGRPAENRLYCHGQGYDMVERPLVRFDEPMPLAANLNIACHPMWASENAFNWVCDNFVIDEKGAVTRIHETPQVIFEI